MGLKLCQNRKFKHFSSVHLPETSLPQVCKADLVIVLAAHNYLLCTQLFHQFCYKCFPVIKVTSYFVCLLDSKLVWMKNFGKFTNINKRKLTYSRWQFFYIPKAELGVKNISNLLLFSERNPRRRKIYLEKTVLQVRLMNFYSSYIHLYI